ncbi:hypothetical protein Tco_0363372 [Tanacetum coccineum]
MGRDTIQLENVVSTISQEYLLEFSSEYFIPENLHPELPGPGDHIVDFPKGKIGVYTKNFKFANFRIPISHFLFDILGYYQIHLSQLSVLGAAKVSHFEINCRILNIIPTVNLFRVDEKVFPTVVAWRTAATKDDKPKANTYSVVDVATLDTHRTPLQKQPEELLCLVGLSRNFFLRDDENRFVQSYQCPKPTKVKTGTRQRTAHEVPLLTATASRVIQMVDATELFTSSGTPSTVESWGLWSGRDKQEIPVIDDAWATEAVVEPDIEKEVISLGPTIKKRRRQRDAGEGGSNAPTKVLRKDHDVACAEHSARGGKSLADMSVDTKLVIHIQETQEPHVATCRSSNEKGVAGNQDSEKSTPSPSITGSQEASTNRDGAQVMAEKRIMDTFEDFKKHKDERVNARCVEMDARLDALSVDFDEELYPHMLTAIAGRRWVIGHGLRTIRHHISFVSLVRTGLSKRVANFHTLDTGLVESGFLTPKGRGVKQKEGLNATNLATEGRKNVVGDPAKGKNVFCVSKAQFQNFASLVTNEAVTCKINFRSLDSDKPINAKAEAKILKFASIEGMNGELDNGPWFIQSAPEEIDAKYGLSVMAIKLGNSIILDSYTSSMCIQSWGRMDYARALIVIRADRELKIGMVIAIINVEGDGEVLHTTNVGSKVQFKPNKPIWQVVPKKNNHSSSGMKKVYEVFRKVTSSNNPFDALNTIEEGGELGSNEGSSNLSKKVVQDVVGLESRSPSNKPFVARINVLRVMRKL